MPQKYSYSPPTIGIPWSEAELHKRKGPDIRIVLSTIDFKISLYPLLALPELAAFWTRWWVLEKDRVQAGICIDRKDDCLLHLVFVYFMIFLPVNKLITILFKRVIGGFFLNFMYLLCFYDILGLSKVIFFSGYINEQLTIFTG